MAKKKGRGRAIRNGANSAAEFANADANQSDCVALRTDVNNNILRAFVQVQT